MLFRIRDKRGIVGGIFTSPPAMTSNAARNTLWPRVQALLSKPICQLPPTEAMKKTNFKNSFKTPSLAEAFRHLTGGKELVEQHRALPDAQACARVYFLMKGVRMPEFPDDAEVLRNELDAMAAGKEFCGACGSGCASCQHREENPRPLPHGKDECDAAQLSIEDAAK